MEDINVSYISRVVDIDGDCNATTRLRPGHIAQPLHRRCVYDTNTTGLGTKITNDIYTLDEAVDDYTTDTAVLDNAGGSATGYKDAYIVVMQIDSGADNIKEITARVMNADEDRNITILRMQSANVGEIDYYKRRF
jgi:hypothetical protein